MKVTLYLPYYDYNDDAFDVNDDYYNDQEYINAISDEYNKNKDVIFNSIMDAKNGSGSLVKGVDGQTYRIGQKTSQREDKVSYSACNGVLYNDAGEEEDVDSIIEKFARGESFVEMVEFDLDSSEEEFEMEYSLWNNEHNGINAYRDKAGDDWVLANESKRNLKIHFKNKANEDVYAILENCKIMDNAERGTLILFVERLSLIDGINVN